LATGFGGKALKPERSVNTTLGLAYRLAPRTSLTLDVYQVRLRDRITPTGSLYLDPPTADVASVTFLTNALDTTTRGLDLVLSHDAPLAGGDLKLTAAFNRNYLREDNGNSAAAVAAGLLDGTVLVPLEGGSPSSKLILTADWSDALWGAHVAATRYGTMYAYSYDANAVSFNGNPAQKYDPAWSVDLEAHYNATPRLTLAAGATDAFNRYPDRTLPGGTYGGAFPYNFANPLGINGAYFYVRAAYRLVH
jgi:iron complex outermembrane receptor protein